MKRSICCVDYLDYDVSRNIYEKYFPSEKAKDWKRLVNDQYKYHLKDYVEEYDDDITRKRTITGYRADGQSYLKKHNFIRYLLSVHKAAPLKKRKRFINRTKAHFTAMKWRKEARFIRRNLREQLDSNI